MSPRSADDRPGAFWAALVPELLVTDLGRSIAFCCDLCGFELRYARPEDGFAYTDITADAGCEVAHFNALRASGGHVRSG